MPVRRDEVRRDETRRDETRGDETRREETRWDETRRDEVRRDETRRDERRWGETRGDETRIDMNTMWSEFACPANQHPKRAIKKKSPQSFAHLVNSSQNVPPMFDNQTILLFWLQDKQTFHMFSLRDLLFVLCSLDLDVQRAQRIMVFCLNYPQISEVGKFDHVVIGARN